MSPTNPPVRMNHEYHKVPITALDFFSEDILLSGEGTDIVAYDVSNGESLGSAKVFESQAIHGILTNSRSGDIFVYGGSYVVLCRATKNVQDEYTFGLSKVKDVGDWILDAAFSPPSEDNQGHVALVTAHNALFRCTLLDHSTTIESSSPTIDALVPGSNCILYCAQISWISASQCLIASGTAFGDIILWSSSLPVTTTNDYPVPKASSQIHYTFPAHEGSVFGVQISPTLAPSILGGCTRALVTCSDDRTVCVYDISDLSCQSEALVDVQRDTGFGSKEGAEGQAPPLLAKAMGHISRIWGVRFALDVQLASGGKRGLRVLSFGEDATRVTWTIETTDDRGGSCLHALKQTAVEHLHTGKNIWAVAMRGERCATGGADGSIAIMTAIAQSLPVHEIGQDLLCSPENEAQGSPTDSFKNFALVDGATLVATTHRGRIEVLTLGPDGATSLQSHGEYQSLRGCSVVAASSGSAFVAGIGGEIYLWTAETGTCAAIAPMQGKCAGLFTCNRPISLATDGAGKTPMLLATSVSSSIAVLYDVRLSASQEGDSQPYTTISRHLDLPPGFVVTSFTMMETRDDHFALLGGRNGSIHIYPYPPTAANTAEPIQPTSYLPHVHSQETITALHWTPSRSRSPSQETGYLFTTGRDGTYAIHLTSSHPSSSNPTFRLIHQLELPFGPSIEGLHVTPSSHLWIYGFRSKHFVVHDATLQQDIFTIDCGGAKRTWSFSPSGDHGEGGTFIWTKASQIFWTSRCTLAHLSIHAGGHGREIKALAISPTTPQIIATGAEDTDIKLSLPSPTHGRGFRCVQTLRKHSTGIQHLQWSEDGTYLFSSGGLEEFCIWKVTRGVPWVGSGVSVVSWHARSGGSDLRVLGFDVKDVGDGEMAWEVTMAYSDSAVKVWTYGEGKWASLRSGNYLTACLTDVLHLPGLDNAADGAFALTAATDGHLALWDSQSDGTLAWRQRRKVHQNAILCTLCETLRDGSSLVFTAGDNNGIGFTLLGKYGAMATLLVPRAHAAAVTALALVGIGEDAFWLVSGSIDQRVKLWEVCVDVNRPGTEGVTVRRLHSAFTSVADVSSMSPIRLDSGRTGILLCGVGMDIWQLPIP